MRELQPASIHPPFAAYAHGTEIPAGWRIVRTSGQLGVDPEGKIPESAFDQAVICFENIRAILAEADMAPSDVAHISAFVTDREHLADYMRARDAFLDSSRLPASTLIVVSGFTRPELVVEVEVLAAAK